MFNFYYKLKLTKIFFVIAFILFIDYNVAYSFLIPNDYIAKLNDNVEFNNSLDETLSSINVYIENNIKKKQKYIFTKLKKGDIVNFGRYYIGTEEDKYKILPIEWIVLDRKNEMALLISRYIIDNKRVNARWEATSWKDCTLRQWLNNDFYNFCFTNREKKEILETLIENPENKKYILKRHIEPTLDKLFLLSAEEFEKYFDIEKVSKNMVRGTYYALEKGLWISKKPGTFSYSVWWLRTNGMAETFAALVEAAGFVGYRGDGVYTLGNGVRPCMWVSVNDGE